MKQINIWWPKHEHRSNSCIILNSLRCQRTMRWLAYLCNWKVGFFVIQLLKALGTLTSVSYIQNIEAVLMSLCISHFHLERWYFILSGNIYEPLQCSWLCEEHRSSDEEPNWKICLLSVNRPSKATQLEGYLHFFSEIQRFTLGGPCRN